MENYKVYSKYGDMVLSYLTFMVNPTINLISKIYHEYEWREHVVTML